MEGVFVDRNGDGVITGEDRYLYHSKDPAVTMNWSNNFSYKNWDFGFTLRSSIGNWLYNKNEVDNSFASNTSVPPLSNLMNKGVYAAVYAAAHFGVDSLVFGDDEGVLHGAVETQAQGVVEELAIHPLPLEPAGNHRRRSHHRE